MITDIKIEINVEGQPLDTIVEPIPAAFANVLKWADNFLMSKGYPGALDLKAKAAVVSEALEITVSVSTYTVHVWTIAIPDSLKSAVAIAEFVTGKTDVMTDVSATLVAA